MTRTIESLGRPASEYGRLCHGDGGHEWGDRRRRVVMLPTLIELTGSIGFYILLAMTVNTCELEAAPGAEVLQP